MYCWVLNTALSLTEMALCIVDVFDIDIWYTCV